jgi:hypothetical protein
MSAVAPIHRCVSLAVAVALAAFLTLVDPAHAQAPATEEAKRAEAAAGDEAAPGPVQPIPFSHAIHSGTYQMDCLYCHSGSDRSQAAGVPSVELCMGCHVHIDQELEGVVLLKKYWDEKRTIEWVQIHRLPEHVQFRHDRHVAAGVTCQACHGPVERLHKLYLVPETKWWPWTTPSKKLEMGWCVQCHRQNEASQDCILCHY